MTGVRDTFFNWSGDTLHGTVARATAMVDDIVRGSGQATSQCRTCSWAFGLPVCRPTDS